MTCNEAEWWDEFTWMWGAMFGDWRETHCTRCVVELDDDAMCPNGCAP